MELSHKDERLMLMDEMLTRKVVEKENPEVDYNEMVKVEQEF